MTLRSFIDETDAPGRTIVVVGDEPGPLEAMLEETFETQPIDVRHGDEAVSDAASRAGLEIDGDTAVLLDDGVPVAASPMTELYESILAINSDLFVTGARRLGEIELPDVIANLDETRLRLRGYPLAHKEKLLLILLSRYIEQRAWTADCGTLRTAFQRLSRIDDEVGTRDVYATLAATDVDVHLYGVDDGVSIDLDATVHSGTDRPYRDGWFVVYRPDDADDEAAALVCLETEPRVWDGVWTRDPDRVATIDETITTAL